MFDNLNGSEVYSFFFNKIIFFVNLFYGMYEIYLKYGRDEANCSRECRFSVFYYIRCRAYVNAFLSLSRLYTLFTTDTAAGPAVSG